ncbi:MAG: leucine-rich repeat protein [Oscillospiraceae bacterium]|nr:leucine-rich repeat protein [Oscillospiraceae bacterium]
MKRALSLFLSFLMVFSLLPVNALAIELQQAEPEVQISEEILSGEEILPGKEVSPEEIPASEAEPSENSEKPEEALAEITQPGEEIPAETADTAQPMATTASGTCGTNLKWVLDSNGTLTISGSGAMTDFSSGSGAPWYNYSSSIKKLVIKEGVTTIGNYAFDSYNNKYPNLTGKLEIPNSVVTIGSDAFWKSNGFTGELVIPDSVKTIKDDAFYGCSGFSEKATIGSGVTSIDSNAFKNCSANEYYFKGNAPSIGSSSSSYTAFDSTDTIYYPLGDSTWSVSGGKWKGYNALPYTPSASGTCGTNLKWVLDSEGTLTISGSGAMTDFSSGSVAPWYNYRSGIKKLVIEEGVTSIGDHAFYGCDGFTGDLVIPDSVTSIGSCAFYSCDGFSEKATIGSGVVSIESEAFYGCSVNEYYFKGNAPSISSASSSYASFESSDTIYYPFGDSTWSVSNGIWNGYSAYSYDIETGNPAGYCGTNLQWVLNSEGTLTISGNGAMTDFSSSVSVPWYPYRSNIKAIVIEEGVTSIGNNAFYYYYDNVSGDLVIPNSVTSIGDYAFYDCGGFTGELVIPDSVTTIGYDAFSYCSGFSEKATIGSGVTSIGSNAFEDCSANEYYFKGNAPSASVAFDSSDIIYYPADNATWPVPNGIWKGYYAFAFDYETETVIGTCGDNLAWKLDSEGTLTISGRGAMADYYSGKAPWYAIREKISKLVLQNGITGIGDYAFDNCTSLAGELVIPRTVETIGDYAFYDCDGFTGELKIPDSVTTIGRCAFYNCSGFTGELKIPDSVTDIGGSAFYNCSGFSPKAVIESGITSIGNKAFYGCSASEYYFRGDAPSVSAFSASYPSFDSSDTIYFQKDNSTWTYSSGKWNGYTAFMYDLGTETIFGYCGGNSSGKNLMWALDTEGTLTISGSGYMADYTSSSPAPWNKFIENVKKLVIESGVSEIGNYAFYDMDNLSGEISLPDSVTSVGIYAFAQCGGLSGKAEIGSGMKSIGDYAFFGCGIDDFYFRGNAPTASSSTATRPSFNTNDRVYFPKNNSSWTVTSGKWNGYFAYATDYATGTIFGYCGANSDSKNIEWSLDENGVFTLSGTGAMRNYNSDNSPWHSIRTRIKTLVIEEGITAIGRYAFYDCDEITGELAVPDSVTSIGNYAFSECGGFGKKAAIGSSVSEIGDKAFELCSVSEFYFEGDAPSVLPADDYFLSFDAEDIIYYPKGNESWVISSGKWNGYSAREYDFESGIISGYCGGENEKAIVWELDSEGNLTISGTGAMKDFSAEEKSPWSGYDIKSIVIENGITHIGDFAFFGADDIPERMDIPSSVTSVGKKAFGGSSAKNYYFPAGEVSVSPAESEEPSFDADAVIYYPINETGWNASEEKWNGYTAKIYDPEHPEYIAMGYCGGEENGKNLKWHIDDEGTLTISGSGKMADYESFVDESGQMANSAPWNEYKDSFTALVIEEGITNIGANAFAYLLNLTGNLSLPEGITSIGEKAFNGCSKLSGDLIIPDSVISIGNNAFGYCYGFKGELVLSKNLETIGRMAFKICDSFTGKLLIPDSVTSIGDYAFSSTGFAEEAEMGRNIISIGANAFTECSANAFRFKGNSPSVTPASSENRTFDANDIIYYSKDAESWPISNGKWNGYTANMYDPENPDLVAIGFCGGEEGGRNVFWSVDKEGTLTISGEGAMKNYSSWYDTRPWENYEVKTLVIKEGITHIGNYSFYEMRNITGELVIPDSVTSIGSNAFYNCYGFTSLKLGSSLKSIGNSAFYNCYGFTGELVIPDSVATIGYDAFRYCEGFTGELVIPDSVTSIGSHAFSYCNGFTSLKLGSSLESIGSGAFGSCSGFTGELEIPDTVKSIGGSAFSYTGIDEFVVGEGNESFRSVEGVLLSKDGTKVISAPPAKKGIFVIPETAVSIENYAFYDSDLSEVVLPESVKTIEEYAFYYYNGAVIVNSALEKIESYGFAWGRTDVYFMAGAPKNAASSSFNGSGITLYYLVGTEDLWTFDENGLWNGKTVLPFEMSEEVTIPEGDYIASGYCGSEPFGGKNMGWTIDKNGTLTVFGTGKMQNYDNVYENGNWVITSPWAAYIDSVKKLVLENGIKTIGSYAFSTGYNISGNLILPESLVSIGNDAFSECRNITGTLVIPEGVVSIDSTAFGYCESIKAAKLPSTLTELDPGAFRYSGIAEIEVAEENGIYSSKNGAVLSKDEKTLVIVPPAFKGSYEVPEGVEIIGRDSVPSVSADEIVLPESVKTIEEYAFRYYDGAVIVNSALEKIESYGFAWGRTDVYFMAGAPKNAASSSFNGSEITLYYLVGTEDLWTFDENGLWNGKTVLPFDMSEEAIIPDGDYVDFGYCGSGPLGGKNLAWTFDANGVLRIFGKGKMQDYENVRLSNGNWGSSAPWANYYSEIDSVIFEEGITEIGSWAFGRCYDYSGRIDIPDSVTRINDDAFLECNNITAVTLGENVEFIGHQTFSYCRKLTAMYIPASVNEMSGWSFQDSGIRNFSVSEDNENYCSEDGVVFSKDKKELVIVPYGRTGSYEVPEFVETIGYAAFCDTGINEIIIHEGVKTVESEAFFANGASVIFMGRPSYIDHNAFSGWNDDFTEVFFMAGAPEEIADGAFISYSNAVINLYYLAGTEDLWNFDGNGLWNGYTVLPFEMGEEATIPDGDYVASGYCGNQPFGGKNLAWTLDKNGVLKIFGSGMMASFAQVQGNNGWETSAPWGKYASSIKEIEIEEGITGIGSYAFFQLSGNAELPESIKEIKPDGFHGFVGSVTVNSRLEKVGNYAFAQWSDGRAQVFFMAGSPIAAEQFAFDGAKLYYLAGTEDLWNFDENGLWNGNVVLPYSPGEETVIPDGDYVDSGYCGFGPKAGKNMAWTLDENGVLKIFGSGMMASFTQVQGDYRWETSAPWGKYTDKIKSIVIEEGIESIGDYAFYRFQWLEGMPEIPSTIKTIGDLAFAQCYVSGKLVLPEGLITLGSRAFGWNSFTEITIPSTLVNFNGGDFRYNTALKNFKVSEKNPVFCEVDGIIFTKNKKNLVAFPCGRTGSYEVPEGTEAVVTWAFGGSLLTEVVLPESVKNIGGYAFSNLYGNVIVKGSSVYLENWAFSSGTRVYFMNGEPYSDDMYPFGRTDSQAAIYYLEGTEDLWNFDSDGRWNGYVVLPYSPGEEAVIPDGDYVDFGYCGTNPNGGKNMAWTLDSEGNLRIFGKGEMGDYTEVWLEDGVWGSSAPWGGYYNRIKTITIEEGVENIGEMAFYRINLEKAPEIAGTVRRIEGWAFLVVSFEGGLTIPEGVEYIGVRAVSSCNFEWVSIPSTATVIEELAFGFSSGIKNINVSEDNPKFASVDGILCNKAGTKIIQFPLGRTGKYTIPDGIKTIGSNAFWNSSLSYIVVPESVKILEDSAFYNVTGTVEIRGQLEKIGDTAFRAYNTMRVNVIFMNGEPLEVVPNAEGENGSFAESSGGVINLYYAKGTKEKWTFDENGLWNGYTVKVYANFGDINDDGKVNVLDANLIRRYAARLIEFDERQISAADVSGDGKVNVLDANLVRRYAAKLIDKFPVEG